MLALIIMIAACKEELGFREPSNPNKSKPFVVSEVQVTNLPGKAKISYRLPIDPNLLYVKATYMLPSGRNMEVKSSAYTNSLLVEGFADTLEHSIRLVSVSQAEVESDPVSVTIKPQKAPIWNVLESITIGKAYGGYKLSAYNETKESVAILVLQKNIFREWAIDNKLSIYSSSDSIKSEPSGMDTIVYNLGIAVRDRWGNLTDTVYRDVLPLFETQLDRSKFKHFPLPGDSEKDPYASYDRAWDGRYGWPVWFSSILTKYLNVPSRVTIDLGDTAKITKVWIRPYRENNGLYYSFTTLKRFELWGSLNPNPNGDLDGSWYLIGSYELKKPSGNPKGTETAADVEAAMAGFYFGTDIDAPKPKVRYFRVKCLENWDGQGPQSIDELKIFGDTRQ